MIKKLSNRVFIIKLFNYVSVFELPYFIHYQINVLRCFFNRIKIENGLKIIYWIHKSGEYWNIIKIGGNKPLSTYCQHSYDCCGNVYYAYHKSIFNFIHFYSAGINC